MLDSSPRLSNPEGHKLFELITKDDFPNSELVRTYMRLAMTELARRNRTYCLAIADGFGAGRRQTDDGLLCHVQRSQVRIGFRDSWKLVCQRFFKFDCVHQITFVVALALNAWGYSAGHRSPFRRAPARYVDCSANCSPWRNGLESIPTSCPAFYGLHLLPAMRTTFYIRMEIVLSFGLDIMNSHEHGRKPVDLINELLILTG